jgi:hypothetical protein
MKNIDEVVITQEEFAGVVAWVESLPLAAKRLGDFVRGQMGESERRVAWLSTEGDAARFESLLAESFGG